MFSEQKLLKLKAMEPCRKGEAGNGSASRVWKGERDEAAMLAQDALAFLVNPGAHDKRYPVSSYRQRSPGVLTKGEVCAVKERC